MKYCSHPGLRPLLPPNPFLSRPAAPSEQPRIPGRKKSYSGVLASINHSCTPQPLPAEHRGRNIIPFPFPDPPPATPRSSDCLNAAPRGGWELPLHFITTSVALTLTRSLCTLIFMAPSVTPQWRQSHAASISLPGFIYLLVFLHVAMVSLGPFTACNSQWRCRSSLTDGVFIASTAANKQQQQKKNLTKSSCWEGGSSCCLEDYTKYWWGQTCRIYAGKMFHDTTHSNGRVLHKHCSSGKVFYCIDRPVFMPKKKKKRERATTAL